MASVRDAKSIQWQEMSPRPSPACFRYPDAGLGVFPSFNHNVLQMGAQGYLKAQFQSSAGASMSEATTPTMPRSLAGRRPFLAADRTLFTPR